MRKILFILLLLIAGTITNTLFAQHIISYSVITPPVNNCTYMSVFVKADATTNAGDSLNLDTYWGDLTKSHDYFHQDSSVQPSHLYHYPGTYTIKQVLLKGTAAGVQRVDSIVYSYHSPDCRVLHVSSFYDANNDCIFQTGTDAINFVPHTIKVDSANTPIDTLTVTSGFYYPMVAPPGTIYKFTVISGADGLQSTCAPIQDTVSALVNDSTTKFIGLSCNGSPYFDLTEHISVLAGRHAAVANIVVTNTRWCNTPSATLTLNFSPKYQFSYAVPAPTTVNGNTLVWTLSNLTNLNQVQISANFSVPGPNLPIGDTIHSSYYLTPTIGDSNIANNTVIHNDTVVSSYDPNYKDVMPKGDVPSGTLLTYNVEFENTGNAPAQNIYILDTLSPNVIPNSLSIVSNSAQMDFFMKKDAAGHNIVKFDFPGINLLDSSHHGQCTGNVIYTVRTKDGLAPGTYISNRAGIYFDDNEVVMTDYAVNKIGIPQSVTTIGNIPSAILYPNPVTDILTINTNAQDYNSLEINNTIGQLLIKQKVTQADTKVNVKNLPAGIYTITLRGDSGTKTIKFEKL